jgi:hypothetical protein
LVTTGVGKGGEDLGYGNNGGGGKQRKMGLLTGGCVMEGDWFRVDL